MTKKSTKKAASAATSPGGFYAGMSLSLLAPNAYNARRFEENMTPQRQARFEELVASIREKGILEPLLVRMTSAAHFEIIAGERRYRAALRVAEELKIPAEQYEVPCMVREVDDDEAFDLMVIENLQREDLTPFETATAFRAYLEKHGRTPEAVGELSLRTGIPAHAIRRQVRLLDLPAEALAAWKEGSLTQSHADLLTRVGDGAQVVDLLAACLRNKLTVRELAERIGAAAQDLDKGFFDKAGCQSCEFNTSVQSGLFADLTPGGKCGSAACFEQKQAAFLESNWSQSKAAEKFGTRGFRFGHRLSQEHREPLSTQETAERCRACDAFVSLLRLTGAVVAGYERVCVGPAACFEELYRAPVEELPAEPSTAGDCGHARPECPADGSTCPDCLDPGPQTEDPSTESTTSTNSNLGDALKAARECKASGATPPATPPEETGPVFDARRGERFRKEFVKLQLPAAVASADHHPGHRLRLALIALAVSSSAAKTHLISSLGVSSNVKPDQLAKKIFEIPVEEMPEQLTAAAVAQVMNDFTLMPAVWELAAERFGIDFTHDWRLNEQYLQSLTKSEIVRIGEEPGVAIWKDEAVEAYRKKHHKGKALRALGKQELVDLVLKSGSDLAGRVPAEVLGRPQK